MFQEEPKKTGPIISMFIGSILIIGGLLPFCYPSHFAVGMIVIGAIIFLLGLSVYKQRVTTYSVLFRSSASGETKSCTSKNRGFIEQIIAALNKAIVARG